MLDHSNKKLRDVWVDNVKVVACILVVLGHFFQSMAKAEIISRTILFYWFNNTIYYFHVPLFFICSGFLYQKYSKVSSFESWKVNVVKKVVALGVPYFVFSIITWILKNLFSSSVNKETGNLVDTLFVHPGAPYWYLYVLFFLFVITLTTRTLKSQLVMLTLAGILKILNCIGVLASVEKIFLVDNVLANWFWFVFGMTLAYDLGKLCNRIVGITLFALFCFGSLFVQLRDIDNDIIGFLLGLTACYSLISIVHTSFKDGVQNKYWQFFATYTMPIFLMHTMFAAPFRSVLTKMGISNPAIHIVMGLVISFCGPIVAMIILEKIKPLDFIVYPTRYLKIGKRGV
ncbi:Fucose 4-O-acetylase [Pseudobutyrivibrio sp. UC1225]|uniref:acyltransferase family protein n=1 Tax=Pseudobutyrivibrio sp. UC1225 TaxID=1798185 RepID=UPI0008F10FCB|nr:acyltransferase [Pseudobutyrivibrio sp. UC1225]SFO26753.1 Fucose 4-O-acetylase [Pseudobutyrivibrio sp. UC1225]